MFYDGCKGLFRAVVLNLGAIEPQGFGESVLGVQWQVILSNKSKKNIIHDTHFIFPTTKGSINAWWTDELAWFSTLNKVKNHWYRRSLKLAPIRHQQSELLVPDWPKIRDIRSILWILAYTYDIYVAYIYVWIYSLIIRSELGDKVQAACWFTAIFFTEQVLVRPQDYTLDLSTGD